MTYKRWLGTVLACALCHAAFWYAVYAIDNAWGLVILLANVVAGWLLLVNTVDVVWGHRLRRGQPLLPGTQGPLPIMTRTILVQETRYAADEWHD
jgi:hypothetical protein